MDGWQLGISAASLVALVVIGVATVVIALRSREEAHQAVTLAETAATLERLDRVSAALEGMRDLVKEQRQTLAEEGEVAGAPHHRGLGAHHGEFRLARIRALRELDRSLNRVPGAMNTLPRSVKLVFKSPDTLTLRDLDEAIAQARRVIYDVADPGHPSRAPVDGADD